MGPTELLVSNALETGLRMLLMLVGLVCIILAYRSIQLKLSKADSTELTMEKGDFKIQVLRVSPFFIYVGVAVYFIYLGCNVTFPRQVVTQPYDINTSFRVTASDSYSGRIPSPGVPVHPDDNPTENRRSKR